MKNLITEDGLIQIEYPLMVCGGSMIASIFGIPMASMLASTFVVVTGLVAVHNILIHLCNRSLGDVANSVCTKGFKQTVQECTPNGGDPLAIEEIPALVQLSISIKRSIDNGELLKETDCRHMLCKTMRLSTVDGTLFGQGEKPGPAAKFMATLGSALSNIFNCTP